MARQKTITPTQLSSGILLALLFAVLVFSWRQIRRSHLEVEYIRASEILRNLNSNEAQINKDLLKLRFGLHDNAPALQQTLDDNRRNEAALNAIAPQLYGHSKYYDSLIYFLHGQEVSIHNFISQLGEYNTVSLQLDTMFRNVLRQNAGSLFKTRIHHLAGIYQNILLNKPVQEAALRNVQFYQGAQDNMSTGEAMRIGSLTECIIRLHQEQQSLNNALQDITYNVCDLYSNKLEKQAAQNLNADGQRAQAFSILMYICMVLIIAFFTAKLYKGRKDKQLLNEQADLLRKEVNNRTSMLEHEKQKIETLNTDLAKLSLVAQHTSNGVIIADMQGNIEWVNGSFERMTGITCCSVSASGTVWEKIPFIPFEEISTALQSRHAGFNTDVYVNGKTSRWMHLSATPIPDTDTRKEKVLILLSDITQRKTVEKELKRSEELYKAMFHNSPVPMYFYDTDTLRILAVNDAMLHSYGYTKEEFGNMSLPDLRHASAQDSIESYLDQKENHNKLHTVHRLKNGAAIDVEVTSSDIHYEGHKARVAIAENITERKHSEEKLRQSEENYRLLFQKCPMPMMILDKDSLQFLGMNDNALRYYEYTQEEFRGLSLADIYADQLDIAEGKNERTDQFSNKVRVNGTCYHLRKDGTLLEVDITSHLLHIDGEERRICIIQDIGEKRRAERALRETEERFAGFMNHNPATAWIKDRNGRYIYVNRTFEEQFCTTLDEICGMTDHVLLPCDIADAITEHDNTVIGEGCTLEIFENVPTPDGVLRHWHLYKFPLESSSGETCIGGIAFDITQQKAAEQALAESERRYRFISENIRDVICLHDKDYSYLYVSPSIEQLTGYKAEDLVGTSPYLHVHPEDMLRMNKDKLKLKKGENLMVEYRFRRKDGTYVWLETTSHCVLDENEEVYQIQSASRDITERKRAESELQGYMKSLEKANQELSKAKEIAVRSMKLKEEFLANTSHEIRTPLNAILGLTRILLNTKLNTEQVKYLKAIESSGDTLMVVLNDILDLSKIEAGKMTFEEIPFNIQEIMQFTTTLLYPKASEKGINLSYNISPDLNTDFIGDPSRLKQILINLIGNAVKFTMEGGVHAKVALYDSVQELAWLEFSVADTGIGIPEHKLKDIFESFTQAGDNINRKFGGTGLGLTIVKKLVDLQSGDIRVESKANKGSTFTFRLPFKRCYTKAAPTYTPNYKLLAGKKALLVDDNSLNLLVGSRTLHEFGMEAVTAPSGKTAISLLQKGQFDILLLDIQMAEMNGYETAEYIRKYLPEPQCNIPILAMTASSLNGDEEKFFKAGMNGYISKPFDITKLHTKIASLLIENYHTIIMSQNQESAAGSNKIVNLQYLRELSDGNNEFVEEMVNMFIDMVPRHIVEIEESLKQSDWKNIHMVAHKIKPSFGFIGQHSGTELLQKIERSAADLPDRELITGLLSQLKELTEQCITELKTELSQS